MPAPATHANPAPLPAELRTLLETRDAEAFEASLDALIARRQGDLFRTLGRLTRDLLDAVLRLTRDTGHAPANTPGARQNLYEVLTMSAEVAHANLALAERLRPQAANLRREAHALGVTGAPDAPAAARQLAHDAEQFADRCLEGFTTLVEKQAWQDLSGQRLQQVSAFLDTLDDALLELARLTGSLGGPDPRSAARPPAVSTQDEVDRLLSDFGF